MLNDVFELKYIETHWHDKHTLISLVESIHPLKLELNPVDNSFTAHTTIYPQVDELGKCQLAFNLKTADDEVPFILAPDGAQVPLKNIVDPVTNKVWWAEGITWLKKYKRWGTQAFRTAGTLTVVIGDITVNIHISLSQDKHNELERYLSSFKNDLWELILDDKSYIGGAAKQTSSGGIDEETLRIISNLLSHAKSIFKTPKAELKEIQQLRDRKQVKPVPRTFMELSTKPGSKKLTSRATEPSYNVPENQYFLYVISSTHKLIKQLTLISNSKQNRYENAINQLSNRLSALKDHKEINKDLVYKDLLTIKDMCDVKKISENINCKIEHNLGTNFANKIYIYFIKITGKVKDSDNTYFVQYKYNEQSDWSDQNTGAKFFNVDSIASIGLNVGYEYQINAALNHNKGIGYNSKPYERFNVQYIAEVRVLTTSDKLTKNVEKLKSYEDQITALKKSNWIHKLNKAELKEQQKERDSILSRISFYKRDLETSEHVYKILKPKVKAYGNLEKELKKLGIRPSSTFPNSMTFVQNQHYQYIHSGYRKLREQIGLADDDILLSLEQIDSIGLINMPILYERWCLLQIVNALIIKFNFICDASWKRKLIRMIQVPDANEALTFMNYDTKRKLRLEYEPKMDNGRTPDFVLKIGAKNKDGTTSIQKFVMDAKFHSSEFLASEGGISGVVKEMAHKRNYSENGKNSVFIIHPTLDAIEAAGGIISPQKWAETSYLGELKLFDWENPRKPHQFGALSANPSKSIRFLDDFHRLLGMFLQYSIEDSYKCIDDDDVKAINFCISCGSADLQELDIVSYNGNTNNKKKWFNCNNCSHHTTYNHCYNCNTRLIKNGEYWTYQSMMPLQPTNIKCPSCEHPL